MNKTWRRVLMTAGFVGLVGMTVPSCVIQARGSLRASTVVEEAPPQPRYRRVAPRAGYVWVKGHWQFRSGRWQWQQGHWERARANYAWQDGHWEQRGNRYHWVAGRWVAGGAVGPAVRDHRRPAPAARPAPAPRPAPAGPVVRDHRPPAPAPAPAPAGPVVRDHRAGGPTSAPPAPRVRKVNPKTGYVWITGRWDWRGNKWVWVDGHWERARTGFAWEAGRWELRGKVYIWVEGRWVKSAPPAPAGPKVRDHRRKPR